VGQVTKGNHSERVESHQKITDGFFTTQAMRSQLVASKKWKTCPLDYLQGLRYMQKLLIWFRWAIIFGFFSYFIGTKVIPFPVFIMLETLQLWKFCVPVEFKRGCLMVKIKPESEKL